MGAAYEGVALRVRSRLRALGLLLGPAEEEEVENGADEAEAEFGECGGKMRRGEPLAAVCGRATGEGEGGAAAAEVEEDGGSVRNVRG